jgi:class 3 adenylate cyclase
MSSHAAVAARGIGRPCVAGAGDLRIDYAARTIMSRNIVVAAGEVITIDGATGEVFLGQIPMIASPLSDELIQFTRWVRETNEGRINTTRERKLDRARGVVWVCDVAGSTKYLNDDAYADALELFLPRLHEIGSLIVQAAGGKFIGWTGDRFFAWFDTPLYRDLSNKAVSAFVAAWHLSLCLRSTQLGVESPVQFNIRHAITYEHDAVLTYIPAPGGDTTPNVIGRNVVLAFRLSSISSEFPSIITQQELLERCEPRMPPALQFKHWRPSKRDILRYFKGEREGVSSIYVSSKSNLNTNESGFQVSNATGWKDELPIVSHLLSEMYSGSEWCRAVATEYSRIISQNYINLAKEELGDL